MIELSIIIPTYNAGSFLAEAVRSVGELDSACEILVVDDGSTDGSPATVAGLPGVQVLTQPNRGPGAARNRGIAAARGTLVAFLDADDRWLPGRLPDLLAAAQQPDSDLFYSDYRIIKVETGAIRDLCPDLGPNPALALFRHNPLATPATAVRRSAALAAGGFREDLRFGEDWDLWLRLAEAGKVAKLSGFAAECRERAQSLARAHVDELHRASEVVLAAALARRPDLYRAAAARARADLALRSGIRAYRARDFRRARGYFWRAVAGGRITPSARYLLQSLR
jgi:glycosyltransferase involved in cell wall biosynthesis